MKVSRPRRRSDVRSAFTGTAADAGSATTAKHHERQDGAGGNMKQRVQPATRVHSRPAVRVGSSADVAGPEMLVTERDPRPAQALPQGTPLIAPQGFLLEHAQRLDYRYQHLVVLLVTVAVVSPHFYELIGDVADRTAKVGPHDVVQVLGQSELLGKTEIADFARAKEVGLDPCGQLGKRAECDERITLYDEPVAAARWARGEAEQLGYYCELRLLERRIVRREPAEVAEHHRHVRLGFHQRHLPLQLVGMPAVVRIQKRDELAARHIEGRVSCCRDPTVRHPSRPDPPVVE